MIKNVKAVFDTNVYLSGLIYGGNCLHLLELAKYNLYRIIITPEIYFELKEKLQNKFKWNSFRIAQTFRKLNTFIELVFPDDNLNITSTLRDKTDEKILRAAKAGNADFIVSGDKHLLDLKKFGRTKILTPAQFLTVLFGKKHRI